MTKKQERLRASYQKKLTATGFRSYKKLQVRRGELIDKAIDGPDPLTEEENAELDRLGEAVDAYVAYKTNDSIGLLTSRIKRVARNLGI